MFKAIGSFLKTPNSTPPATRQNQTTPATPRDRRVRQASEEVLGNTTERDLHVVVSNLSFRILAFINQGDLGGLEQFFNEYPKNELHTLRKAIDHHIYINVRPSNALASTLKHSELTITQKLRIIELLVRYCKDFSAQEFYTESLISLAIDAVFDSKVAKDDPQAFLSNDVRCGLQLISMVINLSSRPTNNELQKFNDAVQGRERMGLLLTLKSTNPERYKEYVSLRNSVNSLLNLGSQPTREIIISDYYEDPSTSTVTDDQIENHVVIFHQIMSNIENLKNTLSSEHGKIRELIEKNNNVSEKICDLIEELKKAIINERQIVSSQYGTRRAGAADRIKKMEEAVDQEKQIVLQLCEQHNHLLQSFSSFVQLREILEVECANMLATPSLERHDIEPVEEIHERVAKLKKTMEQELEKNKQLSNQIPATEEIIHKHQELIDLSKQANNKSAINEEARKKQLAIYEQLSVLSPSQQQQLEVPSSIYVPLLQQKIIGFIQKKDMRGLENCLTSTLLGSNVVSATCSEVLNDVLKSDLTAQEKINFIKLLVKYGANLSKIDSPETFDNILKSDMTREEKTYFIILLIKYGASLEHTIVPIINSNLTPGETKNLIRRLLKYEKEHKVYLSDILKAVEKKLTSVSTKSLSEEQKRLQGRCSLLLPKIKELREDISNPPTKGTAYKRLDGNLRNILEEIFGVEEDVTEDQKTLARSRLIEEYQDVKDQDQEQALYDIVECYKEAQSSKITTNDESQEVIFEDDAVEKYVKEAQAVAQNLENIETYRNLLQEIIDLE